VTAPVIQAVLFPRVLAWSFRCPSVDLRSPPVPDFVHQSIGGVGDLTFLLDIPLISLPC
jgi:hypothetical protein